MTFTGAVLPPLILPGGGRFKSSTPSGLGVLVSVRHQTPAASPADVIRWRFSMNPSGRQHAENGPTIEGRIPARPETPFEECYQFTLAKMGYRRLEWAQGQYTLELGVPGLYRGCAWVERSGVPSSGTQNCVCELVAPPSGPPSVTLGC